MDSEMEQARSTEVDAMVERLARFGEERAEAKQLADDAARLLLRLDGALAACGATFRHDYDLDGPRPVRPL